MNFLKLIFVFIFLFCLFNLTRSLLSIFNPANNVKLHKKRLEQLKFENKRLSNNKEFIDKLTSPVVNHVLPKLKSVDLSKLERDLKISAWDKYFSPVTFRAMDISLKILGIIAFICLFKTSMIIASIWALALIFLFKFLFRNSVKEKKFRLMAEFPEFIEITSGFLNSGMSLLSSIEYALPYVGDSWKPILKDFIVTCSVKNQNEAILEMQNKIDIFEVREFWSLIKLNSDQGIDIKECFEAQSQKVKDMQLDVMLEKINKRHTLSIVIQAPLLLTMIISFGLPTFVQMLNFGA